MRITYSNGSPTDRAFPYAFVSRSRRNCYDHISLVSGWSSWDVDPASWLQSLPNMVLRAISESTLPNRRSMRLAHGMARIRRYVSWQAALQICPAFQPIWSFRSDCSTGLLMMRSLTSFASRVPQTFSTRLRSNALGRSNGCIAQMSTWHTAIVPTATAHGILTVVRSVG